MKALSAIMVNLQSILPTSRLIPPSIESVKRYAMHDITPLATLKCLSIEEVQTAVKFCNKHDLEFVIKASGKNQASHSIRPNSLVLDLSQLKDISHS